MTNQVFKHQAESKVRENVWANPSLETSHLEVETVCLLALVCRSPVKWKLPDSRYLCADQLT